MEDYKKIGLKCGIEIHQQLSGTKLFCRCPTIITDDKEFSVMRTLRASRSETGTTDIAARKEQEKKKYLLYTGSRHSTCLIDLDESPPLPLSEEALFTVLQVAKMTKATIVDVAQVMRKIVIDGSNTSGFQRTALIARNGTLNTSLGSITIPLLNVEEDSAQKLKSSWRTHLHHDMYNLDRLGTPLIEINTGPEIKTPDHAREVAELLGSLLRSTGRVKRGLGTIRQDVNVSIIGGSRVEIKGAQDLKGIPELVRQEIKRQQGLIHLKKEFVKRKVSVDKKVINVTNVLKKSSSKVVKEVLERKGVVLGIKVKNASGMLGFELQNNRRFASELSDYAKRATTVKGLFHSDELPKYGITEKEVFALKKKFSCAENDAFIILAEKKDVVVHALREVRERIEQVCKGVPSEVRNSLQNNTSEFLRLMPGAARMYPETDIPLIYLDKKHINAIKIPELLTSKASRYEKLGLSKDLAKAITRSSYHNFFNEISLLYKNVKATYLAELLVTSKKMVKKQFGKDIVPSEEDFRILFDALEKDLIPKESVLTILKEGKPVKDIIKKFYTLVDDDILKELEKILKKNKDAPFNALIGEAMKSLRGKASGKKISELLRKLVQK